MFLKELEDYPWFPPYLRKMQLEYVGWISVHLKLYQPILKLLQLFPSNNWVDLASGSGWPAFYLQANSEYKIHYTLTDLYPTSLSNEVKKNLAFDHASFNLLEFQPKFIHFKAVKLNKVFSYSYSGNEFWERSCIEPHHVLSDLIQILHPELGIKKKYYFYRKLN